MASDKLVPHLVGGRLLTPEEAKEVTGKSDRLRRMIAILDVLLKRYSVGMLPALCIALKSTGQSHISEKLKNG